MKLYQTKYKTHTDTPHNITVPPLTNFVDMPSISMVMLQEKMAFFVCVQYNVNLDRSIIYTLLSAPILCHSTKTIKGIDDTKHTLAPTWLSVEQPFVIKVSWK